MRHTIILLFALAATMLYAQQPMNHTSVVEINEHDTLYKENKILIKLYDEFAHIDLSQSDNGVSGGGIPAINALNEEINATSVKKLFPFVRKINKQPHDLTTIYEIEYESGFDPKELVQRYADIPEIEFAEPDYIASILLVPNDPYYDDGSQCYHDDVRAEQAWDLTTGDATQIISIIDTGVDWEHDDLAGNIWENEAERDGTPGVDDDGNGFVDDIRGWDFVNDDNNPMDDNSHGTHVAGIAGAKTNNSLGVAGIAWNAKLMAVKVMQSSGRGSWSDIAQGAAYSAENGATVQNFSLGGYSESLTMKTTLENAYHYSVLVAAAGNDGYCMILECPPPTPTAAMYPACYPWVLGVQASTSSGGRAIWSNYDPSGPTSVRNPYGYNYEVLAPGAGIYSTIPDNRYRYLSGTSMATPVVAGAVALIKSYLPNSSHEQVFARIIQASGGGVLDIEEAMTLTLTPDIRLNDFAVLDTLDGCDRDGVADAGETVLLNIEARNYGGLAENVQSILRFGEFEDTSTLTIDDSVSTFGNVSAYARVNNDANPMQVTIPNDVSNNRDIVLNVTFSNNTDEATYSKDFIITAQNGEELKGYNPGLTHLKANRYYLLTENALYDSLIIDPGVEIIIEGRYSINIYDEFNSIGKSDSLIQYNKNSGIWDFIDMMENNIPINFSYCKFSGIHKSSGTLMYVNNSIFTQNYGGVKANDHSSFNQCIFTYNYGAAPIYIRNSYRNILVNNFNAAGSYAFNFYINSFFNSLFNNYNSLSQRQPSLLVHGDKTIINNLLPNYFGSTKESDIEFEIYDFFDDSRYARTTCTDYLTEPHPDVHGHAWKILLNDENPYYLDIDPYGNETVKFDVFFSRSMDTTVTPFLTFGVREPYTQKAVVDSARWVNWKRDSLVGDTYYNIQISSDSTFTTIDFEEDDVLGLDFEFDLEPDTHYFWRVRYKNGTSGDWQQWSDVSNFWTNPSTAPEPPEIIHPQDGDNDLWTDFQARWEEDPYSIGYDIQIDDDDTFASPIINTSTHYLQNFYNVNGLDRGETYYLRVRNNNMYGTSGWSDIVQFEVVGTIPVAPELIYPNDDAEGVSYWTEFRWKELDWADEYEFQLDNDTLFNSINESYNGENNFTTERITGTIDYYWRVRGVKGSQYGKWSEVFNVKRNDLPTDPTVEIINPIDSSKINIGNFVEFKWYNSLNARQYNIELYDSYNMTKLLTATIPSYPDSSYKYNEILNIGIYYWRIRVKNIDNYWEEWSDLYMFEVVNELIPKPLLSVPTNNMKWYDTTLTFKWNNAPGANTVYNARWQAYHTMDFTTGDGLQMIRVAGAKDNEGFEIPIEWNRFEFEVQATAALSNDFIALGEVGKIDLEWGMPDAERDILGFNMYRFVKQDSVNWGDTVKVNNILITDSTFTDYDILPDSTYYYVYRIVRTTLDEGEDSRMVSASAYPPVLDPPNLLSPEDEAENLQTEITFDWDDPSGATSYIIQVSRDIGFTDILINETVPQSEYAFNGFSNRTEYFWKVKAEGIQGTSGWSEIRNFTTIPVIPDVPVLAFPENNSVAQPLVMTFDWENADEADTYQLQIAEDEYFANLFQDISGIISSNKYISGLALDKNYYWRVRSKNDAGNSAWSAKWLFTTDEEGAAQPPSHWDYTDFTGNSSTIIVPENIDPQINGRDILPGDAVGVFYIDEGQYKSAGYGIWEGNNLSITVWGDDDQTTEKDGFAVDEPYKIKLWDSRAEKEYGATVSYSTGNSYYTVDGFSVLGMLESADIVDHVIAMRQGWNMISSYVIPEQDSVQDVFSPVVDDLLIVKNGLGKIYVPSFQINTIGLWNFKEAYQAYMTSATNLIINGFEAVPETDSIPFGIGWNNFAYLRNNPMNVETAMQSIVNDLLIVKNNAGKIYVPSFQINTIGAMQTGEGYNGYLTKGLNFGYPPNNASKPSVGNITATATKLIPQSERTGSEMTLIVEAELENGAEIGIYDANDVLIGSGAFNNGKAGVTIWGDDEYTELKDGATKGETLTVKVLQDGQLIEQELQISNVEGKEPINVLTYSKNAIVMAKITVQEELQEVKISPQPVVDKLNIEMPTGAKTIEIRDMKGKLMLELTTDQAIESIDVSDFSNGTYFITITTENKVFTEKFVKMK